MSGPSTTSYRLQIVYYTSGEWSVRGLPGKPAVQFESLTASLDFARQECAAAPATIELLVDGFYAVIQQEYGWPRCLVAPEHKEIVDKRAGLASAPGFSGLHRWFGKWGRGS